MGGKRQAALLKAAVRKFCLFVSICLKTWNCFVFESNVLRSMCVSLSVTAPVWILYLGITDSSLCLGIYDPNKNFHRILPSEQVTSLPRLFCPTEEKGITVNCTTNGD